MTCTRPGLYSQVIEYDEATVRLSSTVHGSDHPDTLRARNNLVISYGDAGRAQEALHLAQQVLTDREQILGPDHPTTLRARKNLVREAPIPVQQPDLATPTAAPDHQPPSDIPEQPV
ncbi:tetratricopeptide repeat protein [Streptomyces sp. NPDC088847]|uniref:tetratricopeptide repeat protein n=1 Tax=Streptomyces sp. NPDC088847 TaxID=3365909 RepID=UPI00381364A0